MAEDRKPSPDDSQDHGVLDDVGTSTTSIDLGATAQVSVTLPVGYRDDDSDDDVIADELTGEEAARASAIGDDDPEGDEPAEDVSEDDSDEPARAADDSEDDTEEADTDINADSADDQDEPVDDEDDALADDDDDDVDSDSDSDALDASDADDMDDEADDTADEAEADVDDPDSEITALIAGSATDDADAETDATAPDDVGDVDGADDTDDVDGAEDAAAADHSGMDDTDVADDEADRSNAAFAADSDDAGDGSSSDNGAAAADDASASDNDNDNDHDNAADDGDQDVEPFEIADAAADEPDIPAPLTKAPAGGLRPAADTDDNDREGAPDSAPPETTPRKETPVSQPDRPERVSFLRPPARRVDEVEDAANRESSDVLTDERLLDTGAIRRPEPEDPWRRIIYSATGGLINLGDSKKTRARKALMARIAAPLPGAARFVPVMSRKGGVGKTTVTALLGMALADARNDRVVAIDANPDRGTLAERIARVSGKTVRDLVRDRDEISGYGDLSAHVVRDETRLDVLASDADPHVADAFSDADYRNVSELAQHFYSLVLTDTGTGIVHSVMNATLDLADQIVIVSGTSVDEARLASETLTWLETNGRGELARNAVVVINQEASGTELVRLDELESHFRSRARDVVRIPYDARIATGSTITFHDLAPATRQAARSLASLVVEGIRSA
ncbi:hypothetical protein GCM10010915_24360 [Microbacterium faecale]|uniref:CobQ/CobB/MinD/ParA nucleotide binding domain-containing protein n=1 Tax=Microbacterium faecale TaxID=1804630 RepID=A0A917DJN2_9MICO|nr:MinD/ParA family protein [Microbacterium faecale]GGD42382.1 hypothetical protein GCM10010915_24360 [Microbacterium faecale]